MSIETNRSADRYGDDLEASKVRWLFLAFLPCVFGFASLAVPELVVVTLPVFVALNVVIGAKAALGLVRDIANETLRICVAFSLFCLFALLNVAIVFMAAFSGSQL